MKSDLTPLCWQKPELNLQLSHKAAFACAAWAKRERSCRGGTKLCCGSRDPSGTALSTRCQQEWCLSSAQQIQLRVGVSASKGGTRSTQGVIKLYISLPQKFVDARLSHMPEKQRNSNGKELPGRIKHRGTRKSLSRGSLEAGSGMGKQFSHVCFYLQFLLDICY